jgi:F-box-like
MSFNDVPNEVLNDIFAHLEKGCYSQKTDLASLSRTSHRFHTHIEPLLYSSLDDKKQGSLFKYLRTLLECPDLGKHVKFYQGYQTTPIRPVNIGGFQTVYSGRYEIVNIADLTPLLGDTLKVVRKVVDFITFPAEEKDGDRWYEDILAGSWHAVTALVLSLLPNLQSLHLGIMGDRHWPQTTNNLIDPPYYWLKRPLMRAAKLQKEQISSPLAFGQLTTFSIARQKGVDLANIHQAQLMQLLRLNSFRKFVANDWCIMFWNTSAKIRLPIVEMELINCTLDFEYLFEDDVFFRWFPHLGIFRYQHLDNSKQFHPQMITLLIRSLSRLQLPLRELYLGDTNDWDIVRKIDDDVLIYASNEVEVESFAALENLEVLDTTAFDQWIRFNRNNTPLPPLAAMLPRSIKQLTLRHASWATISYVRGLVEKRQAVPELHTLRISPGQHPSLGELRAELASLKEECQRCGINIVILEP